MFQEYSVCQEFLKQLHAPGYFLAEDETGAPSLNRLGGQPSLPADIDWPLHVKTKRPLHFLAQVDLAGFPPCSPSQSGKPETPPPKSGMLFFFADMGGDFDGKAGSLRVLHTAAAGEIRSAPAGLPMIGHEKGEMSGPYASDTPTFEPINLRPYAIDMYHAVEEIDVEKIDFDNDDGGVAASAKVLAKWAGGRPKDYVPHLVDIDLEQFWEDMSLGVDELVNDFTHELSEASIVAQNRKSAAFPTGFSMLGAASGGFDTEIRARLKGYIPLMTFYGHMLRPAYYCDGVFNFWIKPDDLAAGRFDRVWASADHS